MSIEALYRAVFAAPEDDGPRLVLADALQERGDPRGEFISLQLQKPRAQRSERRMQKLLERHRADFLRALGSVVSSPDRHQLWDRGFLSEASAVLRGDLCEVPDWATVRRLSVSFSGMPPLELASPHMRSLEEIILAPLDAVPVVFGAPRALPVQSVALRGPPELGTWPSAEIELLGVASSLPALHRLALLAQTPNFTEADWVWRMPVLSRLRSLELYLTFLGVPLEATLIRVREAERQPLALVLHSSEAKLRLKREDGFRSLVLELGPSTHAPWLEQLLGAIGPGSFDDLLVTAAQPLDAALASVLKRGVKRLRLRNVSLPLSR